MSRSLDGGCIGLKGQASANDAATAKGIRREFKPFPASGANRQARAYCVPLSVELDGRSKGSTPLHKQWRNKGVTGDKSQTRRSAPNPRKTCSRAQQNALWPAFSAGLCSGIGKGIGGR